MEEKKYLKWYNKIGYGSGDLAGNCIYSFLTAFVMIYLTDTVGLNSAVIGTLIMFSKFFDGFTDVIFGRLIDNTHSKLGKARPWMLYANIGNVICLVALFSIPSMSSKMQYAYFFIAYTLLNGIFYTANNIAYGALTSLITKNPSERVQMGSIRFMFAFGTNIVISSITIKMVNMFGGGATGWRMVAIIYAAVALVINTLSVFSVKELSEEELNSGLAETKADGKDDLTFLESIKLLVSNKYFLMITGYYLLMYGNTALNGAVGVYFCTYVLHKPELLGMFSMANMLPMVAGLAITPMLVSKIGSMYKVNLTGTALSLIFRVAFIIFGLAGNLPLMLASTALASLLSSPTSGDINALVSAAAEYSLRKTGKRIEGSMFSCSSLGVKVGGGLGSALSGFLLALGGYVSGAEVQPQSCLNMLNFMYLVLPLVFGALITVILYFLKVEQANKKWDEEHTAA